MMFCGKCGADVVQGEKFCGTCGAAVDDKPVIQPKSAPVYQSVTVRPTASINPICVVLLLVCVILWFAAPFIAINILSMSWGDQPTAIQLLNGNATYIGDLSGSPALWAAIISIIGIVVCVICELAKKHTASRVVAALTDVVLVIAFFVTLNWTDGYYSSLGDIVGIGYIGIFVLLLIVALVPHKKVTVSNSQQNQWPQ